MTGTGTGRRNLRGGWGQRVCVWGTDLPTHLWGKGKKADVDTESIIKSQDLGFRLLGQGVILRVC